MLNSTTTIVAISINIISAIIVLFAFIISLILVFLIIYRLVTMYIGQSERISLYLTLNTLCAFISMFIVLFIHVNLSTICHDFNMNLFRWKFDSMECRLCGFIFFSVICSVFWSYSLQVFFRFVRVVYPMNSWINHIKIYLFLFIPIQWLIAFAIVIPLLTRLNGIHLLLPNEMYCGVQFEKFSAVVYASVAEVWIPIIIISACYVKIVRTIRQRSSKQLPFLRNRRDVKVIHRIIIMIFILSVMNIPTIIYLIIFWISQNKLDPIIYRVTWLSLSIGSLILCIMLPKLVMHVHIFKGCHNPNT
ncbi:unnamed protein product [Adineta steineri]|uniref:G-protein coupled receptors family 1 profile domain-containing protein n=2 Tax=Adineta steineri TaxID=433720 RepID=A0A814FPG4_9BILA|nr:unnamed protein product [Adineta steineri]CAF0721730.1 unnamed protein product [Adineta steineri]CAF0985726.1 unnamed protein product [Adineta steineri]CAF3664716.1 unnamed protein product [Adineta steineri]CAF3796400.1 unnamed protein product [Adineta steineri]